MLIYIAIYQLQASNGTFCILNVEQFLRNTIKSIWKKWILKSEKC